MIYKEYKTHFTDYMVCIDETVDMNSPKFRVYCQIDFNDEEYGWTEKHIGSFSSLEEAQKAGDNYLCGIQAKMELLT